MTIEMKLSAIYRAAHVEIPDQAAVLSGLGTDITTESSSMADEVSKTGHGLGGDISLLGSEVTMRLGDVVKQLNHCSTSLDTIADDFAARDDEANAWFKNHQGWVKNHGFDGTPTQAPVPTPEDS